MSGSQKITVSVVIIAYNEEDFIRDCLKSIAKQTYKPQEVILIDNNSTDRTAAIAKEFNVKIINESVQGMIPARNRGFDEAKGDIIARTDADTVVPPDWTDKLTAYFQNPDVVAVSGPARYGKNFSPRVTGAMFTLNKSILKHPNLYGPNMAIRKSTWIKAKDTVCLSDEEVHEDMDLSIHLSKFGKIIYDPKITVFTSARRMKNPKSLFIDYVIKWGKTIKLHSDYPSVKI